MVPRSSRPGSRGLDGADRGRHVFGANRALGNTRTEMVAGRHVIGFPGQRGHLRIPDRRGHSPPTKPDISDVGTDDVVRVGIVIALACGGWMVRTWPCGTRGCYGVPARYSAV